MKLLILKNRI